MALVSVNATEDGWDGQKALFAALADLPQGRPVILMTHGFRYSPWLEEADPHRQILSFDPPKSCWKAVSWPRHLHLNRAGAGLGIGFGWHAKGELGAVAARAIAMGEALAEVVQRIRAARPDCPVHVMAHSLGARVALSAMPHLPGGALDRVILLSGAEYRAHARAAMASPAGRTAAVLNVTSGENALFDGLFRLRIPAPAFAEPALSAGLPDVPGWTDLRVDCAATRAALRSHGIRTRAPATRVCHWSTYLRPGLFALYRKVLDPKDRGFLERLSDGLRAPAAPSGPGAPLPLATA